MQLEHPIYKPLLNRLIICAFTFGWFCFELYNGDGFWTVLFGGVAAFCIWTFLITWTDSRPNQNKE